MKLQTMLLLIAAIIPNFVMPMEKEPLGKRGAQELEIDLDEQRQAKTAKLDESQNDPMPVDVEDTLVSLPTPLIAFLNQKTPVSTPILSSEKSPLPVLAHTNEQFRCDHGDCNHVFKKLSTLNRHINKYHPNQKDYKCTYKDCNATVQKDEIAEHAKTHTKCNYLGCDYITTIDTSNRLEEHSKIHTGERPHTCDYCGLTFTQKSTLTKHKFTHTAEKPLKCPIIGCSSAYTNRNQLPPHIRNQHPRADFDEAMNAVKFKCPASGCNFYAQNVQFFRMHIKNEHKDINVKNIIVSTQTAVVSSYTKKPTKSPMPRIKGYEEHILSIPTPLLAALNEITPASTPLLPTLPEEFEEINGEEISENEYMEKKL